MALRDILAHFGINVETDELEKGDSLVDKFQDKLVEVGKWVAGAFAINALKDFASELIATADSIGETSDRIGISTQALQEWEYAAKLSGIESDKLRSSIVKLGAGLGKGTADKALKKLGVATKDANGELRGVGDVFGDTIIALGALDNPTKQAGIAAELFGRSYADLIPLINEGPEGLAKLRAEFEKLGGAFSPEFIKQAQEYGDNIDRIQYGIKGLAKKAIGPLLPYLLELTRNSIEVVQSLVSWVKRTKIIQASLIGLTAKGVMALVAAVPKLVTKLGGLKTILTTLGRFVARTVLPLLILEDIIVFLSGGKSAIGKGLDAAFGKGTAANIQALVADMVRFFGLFKSEPGKVRSSFKEMTANLEKELGGLGSFIGGWQEGLAEVGLFAVDVITGGWTNFFNKLKALCWAFVFVFKIAWTELKFAGLAVAAAISDAWDSAWNSIIGSIQSAKMLALAPATQGLANDIGEAMKALDQKKNAGGAGAQVSKDWDKARLELAHEGDQLGNALTSPATATVDSHDRTIVTSKTDNKAQINITVPPGTPAEQVEAVGEAAGKGVKKAFSVPEFKAAHNALVPRPGHYFTP